MPRDKDLKRLVRARMQKTGEAYTTARAQLTARSSLGTSKDTPKAPKPDYAAIAGMSDEKVKAKTGCTWERWVNALDRHGADRLPHPEIAKLVRDKYHVGDWWTQMVTVGYERIKGLRERGQRRDGHYEVNRSRTYTVPIDALFRAWEAPARKRWLTGSAPRTRTAIAPRSLRLGWPDGTIVALFFLEKGEAKSTVAIQHMKLPDRAAADATKAYWGEQLDALGAYLAKKR